MDMRVFKERFWIRDLKDFGAGIGFATQSRKDNKAEVIKSTIQNALKKTFSPEFLNRLDDVIIFNSLEKEHIHKIIDISLGKLFKRIRQISLLGQKVPANKSYCGWVNWRLRGYFPLVFSTPCTIWRPQQPPAAQRTRAA